MMPLRKQKSIAYPLKINLFFCLFSLLQFSAAFVVGQSKDESVVNIFSNINLNNVSINYNTHGIVYNLLVKISDQEGRTIFLDNKYFFKGNYQQIVDMTNQKKGFYYVEIIGDEKRINKKIELY